MAWCHDQDDKQHLISFSTYYIRKVRPISRRGTCQVGVMIMRSYSEKEMKDLRCTFEKTVLSWSHVTQKKTFGCPSYQAGGRTFAILVTKGILITKIDQDVKDTLADQHQDGAIHSCKRNIEHWVRVPINNEAEMEKIMHIVKKSSEIVLHEE